MTEGKGYSPAIMYVPSSQRKGSKVIEYRCGRLNWPDSFDIYNKKFQLLPLSGYGLCVNVGCVCKTPFHTSP